jgi:hypothetical protein
MPPKQLTSRRLVVLPVVWGGLTVIVAAIVVEATRTGIDVLALLIAAFLLLVIERTLGDWVADSLGPAPTVLIFVAIAALGVTYVTTKDGRSRTQRLFALADAHGYHTLYFSLDDETEVGPASRTVSNVAAAPRIHDAPLQAPPPSAATPPNVTASSHATAGTATAPAAASGTAGVAAPNANQPEPAEGARIERLQVVPEVALVGQALLFRVTIHSEKPGTLPDVEFSVNSRSLAKVTPDAQGVAVTSWKTMVPGQYAVRARLAGKYFGGTAVSAALNVLPAKR